MRRPVLDRERIPQKQEATCGAPEKNWLTGSALKVSAPKHPTEFVEEPSLLSPESRRSPPGLLSRLSSEPREPPCRAHLSGDGQRRHAGR
jgi:hypothetical protein